MKSMIFNILKKLLPKKGQKSHTESTSGINNLPGHVAIIMDGNGRWAQEKGYPRTIGHEKGVKTVRNVVEVCGKMGIKILTLYAFSTENWKRPAQEVNFIMQLFEKVFDKEIESLHGNNVRLNTLGDIESMPEKIRQLMLDGIKLTKDNDGLMLNIALNYGGRNEIVRAVRKVSMEVYNKQLNPDDIIEGTIEKYLDTSGLPDPDLLIRTGGNMRISNFLLWQIAYTEILVLSKYWPELSKHDFVRAIHEFSNRSRRFGKVF